MQPTGWYCNWPGKSAFAIVKQNCIIKGSRVPMMHHEDSWCIRFVAKLHAIEVERISTRQISRFPCFHSSILWNWLSPNFILVGSRSTQGASRDHWGSFWKQLLSPGIISCLSDFSRNCTNHLLVHAKILLYEPGHACHLYVCICYCVFCFFSIINYLDCVTHWTGLLSVISDAHL
jgi:hypothetical protein